MELRRTWRRLGLLALVGLCLSWLLSCGGPRGGSQGDGTQEVEFWTMQLQPDFTDYFNTLIAQFEAENPGVTVRWVDVPWGDMQTKILTAVSGGTAPDVVNLNPDFASQLASRNVWMPLDDRVSPEVQATYLPRIWESSRINGSTFALPWYLTTRITLYNQDLFQQAGLTEPPRTYAELATVAQEIRDKTGKFAFFISFVPEDAADVLQSFVQMGVPLLDGEGKAAFNTPAGRAVFQYWTDLFQRGLLPQEVLTQGHRRAVELYQSGETAILAAGAEFLRTIETNAPAIAAATASAPQISGDTGKKNVAVMNLVIPQSTDVPDAALKFALYVTNNDNQLAFAKAANVLPSTVEALGDSHFTNPPDGDSPVAVAHGVSAAQMADAEVLIPATEDIKALQKAIYENLQAAMLGQKTVDQAIADAATTWDNR